ncbi:streptophobe family protein [Streptomyces thermospinosisporus]
MSGVTGTSNAGRAEGGTRVPWGDVVMTAVAGVSWALIGMAATAAAGLHLLQADSAGSLGTMTAAVVALAVGGSVTPSGDVSAFGLSGAEAETAVEITPLGVSLVGALLLGFFFLRSLRAAGAVVSPAELLARAGAMAGLSVAMTGGLVWAGQDVVTLDGNALGLDELPGGGDGAGIEIPGLGDLGDGLESVLPDRIGDLVEAQTAVGFTVDAVPTLLGGLGWSVLVLAVALLASRRTPLPPGWDVVHRAVRPAVSALVTVLLVAVAAGLTAAAYAAIGDDHPRRIAGAALLGAPNGVWLGVPLGLFVPFDGRASGALLGVLPDPLDDLLRVGSEQHVTLARLAGLDGRVWLLAVAAAVLMLLAGVLTGARTPVGGAQVGMGAFVVRCALRLGAGTALALPLLVWLTEVSANASLSVLGIDAFGAGIELRGRPGVALLLGAAWGTLAGAAGAWLTWVCGAAGRRAVSWSEASGALAAAPGGGRDGARLSESGRAEWGAGGAASGGDRRGVGGESRSPASAGAGVDGLRRPGPGEGERPARPRGPGRTELDTSGAARDRPAGSGGPEPAGAGGGGSAPWQRGPGRTELDAGGAGFGAADRGGEASGEPQDRVPSGPYTPPRASYRPPNPATNPYLRVPRDVEGEGRADETAAGDDGEDVTRGDVSGGDAPGGDVSGDDVHGDDVYGAPTMIAPVEPPRRGNRPPRRPGGKRRGPLWPDDGPPPPPPPPPAPPPRPRKPDGGR